MSLYRIILLCYNTSRQNEVILLNKVIKIYLISEQTDDDGNKIDYKEINKLLWELQRQTREAKNKAIQLCWEWSEFSSEYFKNNGVYPKKTDMFNYTSVHGYAYNRLNKEYFLHTGNLSTSLRAACKSFNCCEKEIMNGTRSILSFKSNQPLDVHNKAINLEYKNNEFYVRLSMLNRSGVAEYGIKKGLYFKMMVKDNSTRTILERCLDGIYKIKASKLLYDQKKKMWKLNLCYEIKGHTVSNLDPNKILGIDLGVHYPLVASVSGEYDSFKIKGGEIEHFRKSIEVRKRSLLEQTKYCGDGRIGHGRKKRTEPALNIGDKIARFRDTANHKYSRALVDYAVRKGCGTIQMEDLTGITARSEHFLKQWSYYDLQTKIENKAAEAGIKVVYIDPKYTSQRCSKCGYIHKDNRPTQENFKCINCGFQANADYNASQNIGTKNIDKIIAKELKNSSANPK